MKLSLDRINWNNVKIGAAVIVPNNDESVLFGKRVGSHGAGTWGFPGGAEEKHETGSMCVLRETKEEAGLDIELVSKYSVNYTLDDFKNGLVYLTLYYLAKTILEKPRILEPRKMSEWKFFPWNNLPQPLFLPIKHLVEKGYNPFLKDE